MPKSQRRVTFHLPDGSQESCSDSGLGDHDPVGSGTLISHPLPLVQPQDEFYDQASPDKRTEADGNSDPNSEQTEGHEFASAKDVAELEHWIKECLGGLQTKEKSDHPNIKNFVCANAVSSQGF
eukprot:XP_017947157.1 PREDICTED: protocadherin-9 isoform X3 [Xenopus tropicalis]